MPEALTEDEAAMEAAIDALAPEPAAPLFAKLAKIMGELSKIPSAKLRHVEVQTATGGSYSYDYITEATLMEELRPKLAEAGIAVFYSDEVIRTPEEQGDNLTVVRVGLTFADGESGATWTCTADGYGTDKGDKGANKAKTSAVRYVLWKTFLFASDLDPETESVERRSGGGGARSGNLPLASEKQRALIEMLLSDLDKDGVKIGDQTPQEAVHARGGIVVITGGGRTGQASVLIDALKEARDRGGMEVEALDEILGPPRQGDFPPEDYGVDRPPPDEGQYA